MKLITSIKNLVSTLNSRDGYLEKGWWIIQYCIGYIYVKFPYIETFIFYTYVYRILMRHKSFIHVNSGLFALLIVWGILPAGASEDDEHSVEFSNIFH